MREEDFVEMVFRTANGKAMRKKTHQTKKQTTSKNSKSNKTKSHAILAKRRDTETQIL